MKRCANFGELRGMLIRHDQSIPNLVSSHLFEVQKFPGKCEEIHFMIPPARCVNGTSARQWHTFHHENQLPSLTCSHYPDYHMSRKLPGKLQETILSQPFFSSNKGRYECHIRRSFPKGDSSYHTRPRPAYQELLRASARVERHIESS